MGAATELTNTSLVLQQIIWQGGKIGYGQGKQVQSYDEFKALSVPAFLAYKA